VRCSWRALRSRTCAFGEICDSYHAQVLIHLGGHEAQLHQYEAAFLLINFVSLSVLFWSVISP